MLDTIDLVVQTCCVLHNWLKMTSPSIYLSTGSVDIEDIDSGEIIPGSWRSQISAPLASMGKQKGDRDRKAAEQRRIALSKYFIGEGAVPWQWSAVGIKSVDSCITVETDDESDPDDPDILDEFNDDDCTNESSCDEGIEKEED